MPTTEIRKTEILQYVWEQEESLVQIIYISHEFHMYQKYFLRLLWPTEVEN